MSALPKSSWLITVDEYLANEKTSDVRHEYVNGQIYALAGASQRHAEIIANISGNLWSALRGRPCRVMTNDMKVQVSESTFYYPDVVVTCDPADREPLTVRKPIAAVEVLSPTTALTDHREKAIYYLQMPSLLCYLLVEQDERRIERYWRLDTESEWNHELVIGRSVQIPGIDLELSLDEIYEDISFDQAIGGTP